MGFKDLVLQYVPTAMMVADCLTKALGRVKFRMFRDWMMGHWS